MFVNLSDVELFRIIIIFDIIISFLPIERISLEFGQLSLRKTQRILCHLPNKNSDGQYLTDFPFRFSPVWRVILGEEKKRRATIAVVPRTKPDAGKGQNAAASTVTTAVPTQPTPGLPQSASVTAAKKPSVVEPLPPPPPPSPPHTTDLKEDAENKEPENANPNTNQRSANANPLTAIINEQAMVLTRQHRNRVRMKFVGDHYVKIIKKKENIPRPATATSAAGHANDNVMRAKPSASGQLDAPPRPMTSTTLVRKVKKKIRKIASSANGKLHRAYKIDGKSGDKSFPCRHCGRKYRWKSTLRRHENDECGNKEPAHQCPYCPYKAKQRGNLGVHVRKHHSDKPKLESCRKRKTL